jgi:spore coat polysaccharide biosynthesis protein SpsF
MKIGIFVTARLGSSRLRRKHLLQVEGKPLMAYLLVRITSEFTHEIEVGTVITVIASSDEPENRDFECFTAPGVQVFFGATDNIPLRHHQAAKALGLNAIIAVDGDDILCSVRAMRAVYQALSTGSQYVKTAGLPFGMNSFGYSTCFLAASLAGYREEVLETGWGKIFSKTAVTEIQMSGPSPDDKLRFTLDYNEDYLFFSAVIEAIGPGIETADEEEIVKVVEHKGLYHINESIAQEYWANFYRCMEREKGN